MGWTENRCRVCGKVIPSGLLKCLSCSLNLMSRGDKARCRCRVCGEEINVGEEICRTCGTNFGNEEQKGDNNAVQVDSEAGVEFEEEYVCMICDHPVDKKARNCDFCGTVFYEKGGVKYGPVVERVDRRKTGKASPHAG
jgi:hypothetical protein